MSSLSSPEGNRRGRLRVVDAAFGKLSGAVVTIATVVGTLLALGVIHPFGGGGTSVAQAAVNTFDRGSSRVTITASLPQPDGTQKVLFKGRGEFDYRLNQGHVIYDYPQRPGATVEAILDGNLMYFRAVGTKEWREVDLVAVYQKQLGVDIGPLFAYNSSPASALKNLQASGKIKRIGRELLLDGTMGTHYSGVIDLHKVAANASSDVRAGLTRAVNKIVAMGVSPEIPVQVWIGDDGLVRRLDENVSAGPTQVVLRIDLYDFGVSVNAEPPAGAQPVTS